MTVPRQGGLRAGLPVARPGQAIGLLGGSFDPAHAGHAHITRVALTRFGLDRVWWLVSPGNPLKIKGPAPLDRRLAQAKGVMQHPRVVVTDLEARLNTRFTAATLRHLGRLYPGVRFVWLMGADNLATFHHWDDWPAIFAMVPVGVVARPGLQLRARRSPAARRFSRHRLPAFRSRSLAARRPPAWCYVQLPLRDISSSAIRARGEWLR